MQQYNALDEAKIVASVFAKMRAGFRVAPSQPFRVTPAFTLFKLEMRRDENLKRLDPLRLNIEQALHAARHRAGMIDDLARTVVRINLQPLQLEINRPDPAYLPYDGARLRMEAHTALCGLYYGMRQDTPVLWRPDDPTQPHAWIAGTTGSGKTTLSLSLLASLCAATPPAELSIFINDFKGSASLRALTALPHVAGMATEPDHALCAIRDFHREIMHRKQFGVDGPRCVLYIDELASYSQHRDKAYRTETAELLSECARLGREYKMNLVVCTQKPTSDVIDGQIAANIPFRLVGMVTSPEQSKYATGIANVGAHLLPGRGAFVAVNGAQVTRFQAPMIEDVDAEVARILEDCKKKYGNSVGQSTNQGPPPHMDRQPSIPDALIPVFDEYGNDDGTFKYGGLSKAMQALHGRDAPTGGDIYITEAKRIKAWLQGWVKTTTSTSSGKTSHEKKPLEEKSSSGFGRIIKFPIRSTG